MPENAVQLQQDTLTTVPGGGVRTVVVTVLINGVPTPVQMQVVSIADANGIVFDQQNDKIFRAILGELKKITALLAFKSEMLVLPEQQDIGATENSDI